MNAALQTTLALTLVVLTAIGFIYRWWKGRKKPGCGGGCGCSSKKKF
ncbi:MAG: FeoB-associated Cys-rich membrane protein [Verrucomicrobiae bacterium]|nr:FeoB-associated Cys-rich membrane protein [Verrucomicrobiae bacterium]